MEEVLECGVEFDPKNAWEVGRAMASLFSTLD
jgi:hypothetical protein